jgi:hypothetical protein
LNEDGRIISTQLREVFYIEYWLTYDWDSLFVEWQVQEENRDKSIPLLFFFLLKQKDRNVIRALYLERYHQQGILPEWDCVPMFTELESFVINESSFFDDRLDGQFSDFFDENWRDTVKDDHCYCDFEMCPVTQLLTMDD